MKLVRRFRNLIKRNAKCNFQLSNEKDTSILWKISRNHSETREPRYEELFQTVVRLNFETLDAYLNLKFSFAGEDKAMTSIRVIVTQKILRSSVDVAAMLLPPSLRGENFHGRECISFVSGVNEWYTLFERLSASILTRSRNSIPGELVYRKHPTLSQLHKSATLLGKFSRKFACIVEKFSVGGEKFCLR